MHQPNWNRRQWILNSSAIGAGLLTSGLPGLVSAQSPLTVGFIYVGPRDDYGYNQAHAESAAALKAMPGIKVLEEENVPETPGSPKKYARHDHPGRREFGVSNFVRLL